MNFLQKLLGLNSKKPQPQAAQPSQLNSAPPQLGSALNKLINPPLPSQLQPVSPEEIPMANPNSTDQSGGTTIFNTPMRFNNGPVITPMFRRPAPITPQTLNNGAAAPHHWALGGFDNGIIQVPQNARNPNSNFYKFTPRQLMTTDPRTGDQIPGDINVGANWAKPINQPFFQVQKAAPYYIDPAKQQHINDLNSQPRII